MNHNSKNIMIYLIFLAVIVALLIVWAKIISSRTPKITVLPETSSSPVLTTDVVTSQVLTNGNVLITNKTFHYESVITASWYLEKRDGGGIALYPDYNPGKKDPPTCKLEVTVLKNDKNIDLDSWLNHYLREDPTVQVIESSRVSTSLANNREIIWGGSENGVSTTAAYVLRENTGLVYEIVVSPIGAEGLSKEASDVYQEKCKLAFETFMQGFRLLP